LLMIYPRDAIKIADGVYQAALNGSAKDQMTCFGKGKFKII